MTSVNPLTPSAREDLQESLANRAVPLDAVLVEAAVAPLRHLLPDASSAKWAVGLARRPWTTTRRLARFAAELAPDRSRRLDARALQAGPALR